MALNDSEGFVDELGEMTPEEWAAVYARYREAERWWTERGMELAAVEAALELGVDEDLIRLGSDFQ